MKVTALNIFPKVKHALRAIVTDTTLLRDLVNTQNLVSGGLAIKAGASALVKTVSTIYAVVGGVLVTKAASDMAALSGTVTNAKYNVFCHFMDASGTLTTVMGTEGATLAAVVFPTMSTSKALLGFTVIHPTGTGNFVGGTTALDDATVVPNAAYVNVVGPFDPTSSLTATI